MSLTGRVPMIAVLGCLVGCLLLAACDDAPEQQSASGASGPQTEKRKVGAVPPEMVAAVSSARGAEAVGVHFALKAAPVVGQELPVDILIVPHRKFASVRASFNAPEGLGFASGKTIEPQQDLSPEEVIKHRLVLQPTRDGIYLINVGVDTESEEGNLIRTFSIPVIVGAATAAAPGASPATNPAPGAKPPG